MNYKELVHEIWAKESFLCIGLDTDMAKIPTHLLKYKNPVLEFNKEIIEATKDLCIAYKPNTAFYEALGADYWSSLKGLIQPWLNRGCFINHQISKYGKIRGFDKRAVDKQREESKDVYRHFYTLNHWLILLCTSRLL